jgi:hypothetical protein
MSALTDDLAVLYKDRADARIWMRERVRIVSEPERGHHPRKLRGAILSRRWS